MKILNHIAEAANRLLRFGTGVFAFVLLFYGLYVLYDIYYTGENAFVSKDLLQYRPKIVAQEEEREQASLDALTDINPDTVGWIEIFGTHINYPVMHGSNDLEYLNKDIYGNMTLTGSIYLAADNANNFGDWYNVIYGHHMDNGAMFGDIDKYLDEEYFHSHNKGILQTPDGDWEITIFACVSTDSYEGTIYNVRSDVDESYPPLRDYILTHSFQHDDVPPDISDESILLGLSTCTDAVTNGRIVLFAEAVPLQQERAEALRTEAEQNKEKEPEKKIVRFATGHSVDASHWALLNLVCVLLTLGTAFPITALRRKFRQMPYAKRTAKELSEQNGDADVIRGLKRFLWKMRIALILEILIFAFSVVAFLLTENITKRMTLRDEYTGGMIAVAAFALLIDFICFRYRGKRPDTEELPEN